MKAKKQTEKAKDEKPPVVHESNKLETAVLSIIKDYRPYLEALTDDDIR